MVFDIAIQGEDNDGNSNSSIPTSKQGLTEGQIKNVMKCAELAGKDSVYVISKAQVNSLEDIQQGRLKGLLNHLDAIRVKSQ